MELVTASDLFVTASLALLLSLLVAKLVSLAMTDTHTTTNHHVHDEPVGPVLQGERLTVHSTRGESRVDFITPVQLATANVETGENIEEATVESNSKVFEVELPAKPDIAVDATKEKEEIAEHDGDSSEQRNAECVEEIIEERSMEMVVPIVGSETKERDEENDDDDWEWEGIERSELEEVFMAATEFVAGNGCGDDDVQMELFALHKVAIEGPCRDPQPMPLKLSARAKWNAWQKLGNMSPEVAMEQYISLLSDKVPEWMRHTSAGTSEHEPKGSEVSQSAAPELSTSLSHQQMDLTERELEQESGAQDHSPITESNLENNVQK